MEKANYLEKYPYRIVLLTSLQAIFMYGLGFLIMYNWLPLIAFLYLAFVLVLEFRLIRYHCVNCYYWGKICGFGKGRLSSFFFRKGEPVAFCAMEFTWKSMIPDMLVAFIPVITGIVLLIIHFDLIILFAMLIIVFLTSSGNALIRGKLTCPKCRQRELGCPAEKLFNKKDD
jgi:hypothetical protein